MTTYLDEHARAAARAIGHGSEVSVTFLHLGAPVRGGSSSPRAARCDQVEVRMDEGPCIEAMSAMRSVEVRVVADDGRWPAWADRTTAEGFTSCVAEPAAVARGTSLAVNVYLPSPWTWDPGPATAVAGRAHRIAHDMRLRLTAAAAEPVPDPSAQDRVQQAVGVLMHGNDIGAVAAERLLARAASVGGTDVEDVARALLAAVADDAGS